MLVGAFWLSFSFYSSFWYFHHLLLLPLLHLTSGRSTSTKKPLALHGDRPFKATSEISFCYRMFNLAILNFGLAFSDSSVFPLVHLDSAKWLQNRQSYPECGTTRKLLFSLKNRIHGELPLNFLVRPLDCPPLHFRSYRCLSVVGSCVTTLTPSIAASMHTFYPKRHRHPRWTFSAKHLFLKIPIKWITVFHPNPSISRFFSGFSLLLLSFSERSRHLLPNLPHVI